MQVRELYTMVEIDKSIEAIYKPDFRLEAQRVLVREYAPKALEVIERQIETTRSLKRKNRLISKKKYWEDLLSRARV